MPGEKTCFVIMPITTPPEMIARYADDSEHFRHVLEHLFVPAIQQAGYRPILPIAEGSELIHAEIVRKLEEADLVLCDMSTMNANVFFELGIRTALDKSVCLVRDRFLDRVPFDTTLINHHMYDWTLSPWILPREVAAVASHLSKSTTSSGRNPLWTYFGLTTRSHLVGTEQSQEDKLSLIVDLLRQSPRAFREPRPIPAAEAVAEPSLILDGALTSLIDEIKRVSSAYKIGTFQYQIVEPGALALFFKTEPSSPLRRDLYDIGRRHRFRLEIHGGGYIYRASEDAS